MKFVERTAAWIQRFAGWMAVGLLGWMVLLATAQLFCRWFKIDALGWGDVHLRHMLVWFGLTGGVLAAAQGRHIQIDVMGHYFPARIRVWTARTVSAGASVFCIYLTIISLEFLASERGGGSLISGLLFGHSAPVWWAEIPIPFAFLLMGLLFICRSILPIEPFGRIPRKQK